MVIINRLWISLCLRSKVLLYHLRNKDVNWLSVGEIVLIWQRQPWPLQEAQERHSNTRRLVGDEFRPRDRVWLKLKHVKTTRPIKKLDWIALPYRVLAYIDTHAVQLDTPAGIHLVFHVSLVKKGAEDPLPSQLTIDNEFGMIFDTPEDPSSVAINSDGEYTIERIFRHRRQGRGWRLLVKWLGWPEPIWKPLQQLQKMTALDAYERLLHDVGSVIPWDGIATFD